MNNKENTTETLTIRLPAEILLMLDKLVEKQLFANRSEAIREFCRRYVKQHKRGERR